MAWTNPTTRSTGYTVTATNWNELVNNSLFLARVAYVEFTSDVSVTATTVGTANQIVSAGAISLEAVPHVIEFYCPRLTNAAVVNHLILRDVTTVVGTLTSNAASANVAGLYVRRIVTPTAASHTYNVASWNAAGGTWTYQASTGGTTGDATTFLPGYIMIYRLPT